jgi:hypothetical protein
MWKCDSYYYIHEHRNAICIVQNQKSADCVTNKAYSVRLFTNRRQPCKTDTKTIYSSNNLMELQIEIPENMDIN